MDLHKSEKTIYVRDAIRNHNFQSKSGKNFSIKVRLKIKNQSPVENFKSRFD